MPKPKPIKKDNMPKFLLWVLLCLPALAHAQNAEQAKFLAYFPTMSTDVHEGTKLDASKMLRAHQCGVLYSESTIKYEGENISLYPIAKIKHSENTYSVVYLEVRRMPDYCRGKTCYMATSTITTLVFNGAEVTKNSFPVLSSSADATVAESLEPYSNITFAVLDKSAGGSAEQIWVMDKNTHVLEIKTFVYNAKEKAYTIKPEK
jgi:hypothetical protein